MRIVSLLPSATEIICALGMAEQLVGVTHECDFPPSVKALPKVTQTLIPSDAPSSDIDQLVRAQVVQQHALYQLDLERLRTLRPDLIVTQALCDVCAVAESEVRAAACSLPEAPPVLNLEPQTLFQVLESILQVGAATGRQDAAALLVSELRKRIEAVAGRAPSRRTVVLLEWLHPLFSSGHWMPELVRLAGGVELVGREGERSREIRWEQLRDADPDVIVIACCGFDVQRASNDLKLIEADSRWTSLRAVRERQVFICDGSQYFSRPGPRLVDSLELLRAILSDETVQDIPRELWMRM